MSVPGRARPLEQKRQPAQHDDDHHVVRDTEDYSGIFEFLGVRPFSTSRGRKYALPYLGTSQLELCARG